MKTMRTLWLLGLIIAGVACTPVEEQVKIHLVNPTDIQRLDEPITLQRDEFANYLTSYDSAVVPVLETVDGEQVPSQVDDLDGDGSWDELFFLYDLEPSVELNLNVSFVQPDEVPDYAQRANVRFGDKKPPYKELDDVTRLKSNETAISSEAFQMEGPAWENDVVAFRNYFDARNGIDIYGKRTDDIVIDSVGLFESYHELQDWGMDVLKVGNSLGAGSIALQVDGEIYRIGMPEKGMYHRLADGPLRAMFRLTFEGMDIGGRGYDIIHDISIWGGTHFYKSSVEISGLSGNEELVTGIVNMEIDTFSVLNHNDNYVSLVTHGNQAFDGEILGMGILVHKDPFNEVMTAPEEGEGITQTYMVSLDIPQDNPVDYYFFAGWELQNPAFKDKDTFVKIIDEYAERLANPVTVNLE